MFDAKGLIGTSVHFVARFFFGSSSKAFEVARKYQLATGGTKKPHCFCPGTVALPETRQLQKSTDLLMSSHFPAFGS